MTEGDLDTRMARVLFAYRLAPHSTTGVSPSELLLGRRPRSRLDLVRPNTAKRVENKQLQQKTAHDVSARQRKFEVGDLVYILNFRAGEKWIPGEIIQSNGSVSFSIQLQDGKIVRRHQDHMRQRTERSEQARSDLETVAVNDDSDMLTEMPSVETLAETSPEIVDTEGTSSNNQQGENSSTDAVTSTSLTSATPRYPQRVRKEPDRFHPSF